MEARKKSVSVLIVDDSAVVRQALSDILGKDRRIQIMGTAGDPFIAASKIAREVPDVILLDVEMPRMDGLSFLQRIMTQRPIPVVVFSSLSQKGSEVAIKALEYGAVEVLSKPADGSRSLQHPEVTDQLIDAVIAASQVSVLRRQGRKPAVANGRVPPKLSADAVLHPVNSRAMVKTTEKVVAIGASTGGTEAIRVILEELEHDVSGIVIVQHMPEMFTRSFADRLNDLCRISVKEAENGDSVIRGRALIAPGNRHMILKRSGARYYVEVIQGELVNRHRPSVDVLFRSVAQFAGRNALGILLTGMGDDGARGLLEMRNAGAHTIAQNEATSVVFGMPAEAIRMGGASEILPLDRMAHAIHRIDGP